MQISYIFLFIFSYIKQQTCFFLKQVCCFIMAPQVGLEPTTLRLTAACSTNWAIEEYLMSGNDLLSRAVARQVSSAPWSLTSVFGMGTGGTSMSLSPDFSLICSPLSHSFMHTLESSGLYTSFWIAFHGYFLHKTPFSVSCFFPHFLHLQNWTILFTSFRLLIHFS